MTEADWRYLWLPTAALGPWCILRLEASPWARAMLASRKPALIAHILVREFLLFCLCIFVAFGPTWDLRNGSTPAFVPPLIVAAALLLLAAWAEGKDGGRNVWLRPLLLALALVGHWSAFWSAAFAVHDALITQTLVNWPGNLGRFLFTAVVALVVMIWLLLNGLGWVRRGLGAILGILLAVELFRVLDSRGGAVVVAVLVAVAVPTLDSWFPRWGMNRIALICLRLWFGCDRDGRRYAWWRHVAHYWTAPASPRPRWTSAARLTAGLFAGGTHSRFRSPRAALTYDGAYIHARRDAARERAAPLYQSWRAAHMIGANDPDMKVVRKALADWARWERVVQDEEDCPHGFCRRRRNGDRLWRRAARTARLLAARRALPEASKSDSNEGIWSELQRRLVDDLNELRRRQPGAGWLSDLAAWWSKRENLLDDVHRHDAREAVLRSAADQPSMEIAVALLLDAYREAGDWAGMIETARRLGLASGRPLAAEDHREIGEAYWRHGDELGDGPLGDWTREKAIGRFLMGGCAEHLGGLPIRAKAEGKRHDPRAQARREIPA